MSNVWQNNIILKKADQPAHDIYQLTKKFPRTEQYGLTSQLRRTSLSVVLTMIEGYARFKQKSHLNFLEISFGSLKETQYLINFCYKEGFFNQEEHVELNLLCEETSKMLYAKINTMKQK
jgi:four helix bundle protein